MKRAIRVATICHSEDNHLDKNHRRVRLELHKNELGLYKWYADGEEIDLPSCVTVSKAETIICKCYDFSEWDLKATWL